MAQDPIVEQIRQAAKNKTLTIDELITATRQSEQLAGQFDQFLRKHFFHNLGQEELRKLILSGLDSAPWTDLADKNTSTKHGLDVLASIKTESAASRLGFFGRGSATQAEANKEEKPRQEEDAAPKKTPPQSGP